MESKRYDVFRTQLLKEHLKMIASGTCYFLSRNLIYVMYLHAKLYIPDSKPYLGKVQHKSVRLD